MAYLILHPRHIPVFLEYDNVIFLLHFLQNKIGTMFPPNRPQPTPRLTNISRLTNIFRGPRVPARILDELDRIPGDMGPQDGPTTGPKISCFLICLLVAGYPDGAPGISSKFAFAIKFNIAVIASYCWGFCIFIHGYFSLMNSR